MANFFTKAWDTITSTVQNVGNTIYDVAKKVISPIVDNAGGVMATIAGVATGNSVLLNAGVNSIASGIDSNSKANTSVNNVSVSENKIVETPTKKYKDSTIKYLFFTNKLEVDAK